MNRALPEISESAAELTMMIRKEKKARIRDRIRVLWLLKTGQARNRGAAKPMGVRCGTVGKRLRTYKDRGLPALLRLNTVPGNARHITGEAAEALKKRLASSDGSDSYTEIQAWLKENHNLHVKYKTFYKTVCYDFGAKLKVPRPSHIKKTRRKSENSDMPVRIFSYDETGVGMITAPGKKITLRGVRPVVKIQRIFENYYIYGATGIPDGKNFFPEFPVMNIDCFQCLPNCLSEEFPDSMNLLLTDNAGIPRHTG